MLARIWRKGNPITLLVEMQTGAATVENSMELPQKTKNETACWGLFNQIQLELCQQLQDIKRLFEQEVFQTLNDNLQWLSPKTWFEALNF